MKNYRKHIDDFFREKLGNYRETPPPEAWEELEGRLDNLTPVLPISPAKWLWHLGIVSLLLVLGISAGRNLINNAFTGPRNLGVEPTNATGNEATAIVAARNKPEGQQNQMGGVNDNDQTGTTAGDAARTAAPKGTQQAPSTKTAKPASTRTSLLHHLFASRHAPIRLSARSSGFRREGADNATGLKPQAENNYQAAALTDEAANNEENQSAASPELALSANQQPATLPGTFKKADSAVNKQQVAALKKELQKSGAPFRRFEAGIKAGYEQGSDNQQAVKLVLSPYLQYNLSAKVALMTQPAIKSASVSSRNVGSAQNYYNVTGHNTTDSSYSWVDTRGPKPTTHTVDDYQYTETHDSVVKSYKYGGTYTEFELPILLKYRITSKVSVYGGVNLTYNKFKPYTENSVTTKGLTRTARVSDTVLAGQTSAVPSDIAFTYTGKQLSGYKNPYATQQSGQLMAGYMVGVSYEYSKKWLIDALIQQTPVSTNGNNNGAQQQGASFRVSVGYKLTK